MNTFLPFQSMQFSRDPLAHQTQSPTMLCNSPLQRFARLAFTGLALVLVAACGGGGGSKSAATTPGTTTTTVVVTDTNANAQAFASMSSTPVSVSVWALLNSAGADIVRSMVPTNETVSISTFKTIADPTGGPGTIKVFDAIVASGVLNSSRVFQLSTGTLPTGTTSVWVNVNGEDFTKNNPDAESALEIRVTDLVGALPTPLP